MHGRLAVALLGAAGLAVVADGRGPTTFTTTFTTTNPTTQASTIEAELGEMDMFQFAEARFDKPLRRATAIEVLSTTRCFAGMVGIGPTESTQLHAFRVVLAQPDAKALFLDLLKCDRLEGQLYGLCGLYFVDKDAFDAALPRYQKLDRTVSTQFFCVGHGAEPLQSVLKLMSDGTIPGWFRPEPAK